MKTVETIGTDTGRGFNSTTYSGLPFWVMDPKPEDIRIEDIAHSLAMQCRFNGHTLEFYSVAQHSYIMSHYIAPEFALEALLHDATETYIGDLIKPVKQHCPDYCEIEANLDRVIRTKFGLPLKMSPEVKWLDMMMAVTEKMQLLAPQKGVDWGNLPTPLDIRIDPLSPKEAKACFMNRYKELTQL